MYAFVDESGNTGPNLFDPEQPTFYAAAVISKIDLDLAYAPIFAQLAKAHGLSSLHAAEMGNAVTESILPEIQRMVKRDKVRFFLGEVNKSALALTKLADTLLDSAENRAVPWTTYNVQALRLLTVLKLSLVAPEPVLRAFWDALMEQNPSKSEQMFIDCLRQMQPQLPKIPDERSRQVIGDAIQWAIDHPEAISVHAPRSLRLGHLPHLVLFPTVLHELQRQSEYWKTPVVEIRHDQESLVASAMRKSHEMLSKAPIETVRWVDFEIPIGAVPGSVFRVASSKTSAGIQLADIVLWLYRRERENRTIGPAGKEFLKRVRRNGDGFELSLRSMEAKAMEKLAPALTAPLSPEQLENGRKLMAEVEERRMRSMAEYKKKPDSN